MKTSSSSNQERSDNTDTKVLKVYADPEQLTNGSMEHYFNIPLSVRDFGRLTAKEFLAQLKQNIELRLNKYEPPVTLQKRHFEKSRLWNTIVIKKEWISWIITTLRNLTWLDYNSGGKEIVKEYEDCELAIIMFLLEGEYSFIKIFPVWKDEVDIQIIYDSNSKRPKRFLVEYKISNEPTVQMIFNN